MKKIIKIDGMKCDKCVSRIKNHLENVFGIKRIDIKLENKEAIIEYDSDIDLDLVKESIEDLGFKAII